MLSIKDIDNAEIMEMATFQQLNQPNPCYSKIQILRGCNFYARCLSGRLQQWTCEDGEAKKHFDEAVKFEVELGSTKL